MCIALLYMQCERYMVWPDSRVVNLLVRLPKPDGGSRLIALMSTLIRVWGRVRRPLSTKWEADRATMEIWGVGKGRSSSAAAFSHNLDAEIAQILDQGSITVMIDFWKAFETVARAEILQEAVAVGCPHSTDGHAPHCEHEASGTPGISKLFQGYGGKPRELSGMCACYYMHVYIAVPGTTASIYAGCTASSSWRRLQFSMACW